MFMYAAGYSKIMKNNYDQFLFSYKKYIRHLNDEINY